MSYYNQREISSLHPLNRSTDRKVKRFCSSKLFDKKSTSQPCISDVHLDQRISFATGNRHKYLSRAPSTRNSHVSSKVCGLGTGLIPALKFFVAANFCLAVAIPGGAAPTSLLYRFSETCVKYLGSEVHFFISLFVVNVLSSLFPVILLNRGSKCSLTSTCSSQCKP